MFYPLLFGGLIHPVGGGEAVKHRSRLLVAFFAALALAFCASVASSDAWSGHGNGGSSGNNGSEHVTICHAIGTPDNAGNGYVRISPSASGVYHGHYRQHDADIIPPFNYQGQTYSLNWNANGQAIYNNGCQAPAPQPTPSPTPTPTPPPGCGTPGTCPGPPGQPGKSYGCDGKEITPTSPPATCPGPPGPPGQPGKCSCKHHSHRHHVPCKHKHHGHKHHKPKPKTKVVKFHAAIRYTNYDPVHVQMSVAGKKCKARITVAHPGMKHGLQTFRVHYRCGKIIRSSVRWYIARSMHHGHMIGARRVRSKHAGYGIYSWTRHGLTMKSYLFDLGHWSRPGAYGQYKVVVRGKARVRTASK